MKETEVKVGEKTYTIKELKYKDIAAVADLSKAEVAKSLILAATGITPEEYEEISMKDGIELMTQVNAFNGLDTADFQPAAQTTG